MPHALAFGLGINPRVSRRKCFLAPFALAICPLLLIPVRVLARPTGILRG
jgi:hypothetical protein